MPLSRLRLLLLYHFEKDGSRRSQSTQILSDLHPLIPQSSSLPNRGSAATSSITPHSTGTIPSKTYTGWPSNRTLGRAGYTVSTYNEPLVHCRPPFVYVLANMVSIFQITSLHPVTAHLTGWASRDGYHPSSISETYTCMLTAKTVDQTPVVEIIGPEYMRKLAP